MSLPRMGVFIVPAQPPGSAEWSPPSDWPDISQAADNTIEMIVSDLVMPSIAIGFDVVDDGTVDIDWGDGVIETELSALTTPYEHHYTTGGTPCSEGYNTWKIKIYNASGNITSIGFEQTTDFVGASNYQVSPLMAINIQAQHLTVMDEYFLSSLEVIND